VDACYVSAPAYQPFELWKGLGSNGGVVKLPLAQATLQVMLHSEAFPTDFAAKSRQFFWSHFDENLALIQKAEANIPAKYWINLPTSSLPGFDDMFQETRVYLRDTHKTYHPQMLKVMRDKRCAIDGARAECAENKE
jgi:hypothetical protein